MLATISDMLGNMWWTALVGVVCFVGGVYFSSTIKSKMGR